MIHSLLLALLPIFLIIGLGIFAGRTGRIDNVKVSSLNTLVMDFALPAAMFSAILHATRRELLAQWGLLLMTAGSLVVFWLLVYALQRGVFRQSSGGAAVLAISVALPNFAAAGVPLLGAVAGEHGRMQTALAISVGAVILSPMTLLLLDIEQARQAAGGAGTKDLFGAALKRVARAPLVIAPVLAIILVLADVSLPAALLRSFMLLGLASSGVALLLTGLVLSANKVSMTVKVLGAVLLANILHPLVVWAFGGALPIGRLDRIDAVLLNALPSGFFGIFFALRYGVEIREAASVVAVSTVFSIVTLATAVVLTGALQGGVPR